MKNFLIIFSSALVLVNSSVSYGDAIISYSGEGSDQTGSQTAYVQDGRVLIKDAGDANTDIVFEPASATMYVLDHSKKTAMRINEQAIDNFAGQASGMASIIQQQLAAQMQNMSAEEQAQMQELMGGFGLSGMTEQATPSAPTLQQTGNAEYGGIACSVNNVIQDGQIIANVCFSQGNNIGISDEDYQTLVGMQNFTFKMASKAQQFSGMLGGNVPEFGDIETDNLIIQGTNSTGESNSMNIEQVSNESIPAGTTALPTGYAETQLPSLSDLM